MLGEQIGEDKGRNTGHRVYKTHGGGLRVEVSMQATGKILGVGFKELCAVFEHDSDAEDNFTSKYWEWK